LFFVLALLAAASSIRVSAQQQPIVPAPMPHVSGQGIAPAYEGWYRNSDGTYTLSFGYFNRNYEQAIDVPIGPNNRVEPGQVDQGQPTHFATRRHTGVFTVTVPADFGLQRQITWTITANGVTNSVPGHLRPEWEIDALKEVTSGNTPPVLKFDPAGAAAQGPRGVRTTLKASLGQPATLNVWVTDDMVQRSGGGGRPGQLVGVTWSKFRGPGAVTFAETEPKLDGSGKATTTVSFGAPGEYMLRVLAWDSSGGQGPIMAGGFQCCWTNGFVNVTVTGNQAEGR